ncbi:cupin-like domain-containing protein [Merismopedia glauca]|uniref:Transcription factor jumonji jmjC domain-containing protein n=1 Tax=Merismopedia glauca CCAP 1448/3 TaxID=1296344 RepID=A0A2T1C5Y7_9CYAN|nr:cupin-like domain-containing protein [Merismopedia glauca]PSB03702.1 transcription factor jumonji jmjC domain-containing protein [Merismopedia glauca CCAP 1448/3]
MEIDILNTLSINPEIFNRFKKQGKPVVIPGLLTGYDWDLNYLVQQLGNQEFLLRFYGKDRYQHDKRNWESIGSGVTTKLLPFNEYAELLKSHQAHEEDIYLAKCSLKHTPLGNLDYLANIGDRLSLKHPVSDFNIWIGPGGHMESLHYDTLDGTLMQLHGSKKIVLFPPNQLNNLYPFPIWRHLKNGLKTRSWFSQAYPENPNFRDFPNFKKALNYKYEVTLNRGEILYIPAGWWHEVTALGDEMVCSVNRFWRVYPTSRAIFSWARWRTYLGFLLAMPSILLSLAIALFSPNRTQKIQQIRQMF